MQIRYCVTRLIDSLWVTCYTVHRDGKVTILWRENDIAAANAMQEAASGLNPRKLEQMEAFGDVVETNGQVTGLLLWDIEANRNSVRASFLVRNPAHRFDYKP